MKETAGTLRDGGRGIEMVKDHEGAGSPQHSKDGGYGEEDGSGFASGVPTQSEAAAPPAQLPDYASIEGEEDGAGDKVDCCTMSPHQDVLGHCFSAALSSSSSFVITANRSQAVPQLRPPIIRSRRDQTPNVHSKYDLACSRRVGDSVVAKRVANSDVAING